MMRLVAIPMGVLGCGVVLFACVSCGLLAAFLQSLHVLSGETVVAEIIMSPIQTDAQGTI